jgi:metal-responsive CopG/Arc/MetJ family transcriptional regulator
MSERKGAVAHVQVSTNRTEEEHAYKMMRNFAETYDEHIFMNTYPIQTKDYNFLCVVKGPNSNKVETFVREMTKLKDVHCAKVVSYRETAS